MRRAAMIGLTVSVLGGGILLTSGCGKDSTPPPPPPAPVRNDRPAPPPTPDAPTINISASPATTQRGRQSTLSWRSNNASSVTIDNGIGNVGERGSVTVTPSRSTTYTATAKGPGGETRGSTRVTVIDPPPPPAVDSDFTLMTEAIRDGRVQAVYFGYDKAELTDEAKAVLRENARWLRQYPGVTVIIEGHCDERGTEEYNLALGDRRALVTLQYLRDLGVDTTRLETISYGEEKPAVSGTSDAAYAKNRRAEFRPRR